MKINEFKTELNGLAYTTTDKISGTINVYSNRRWEIGKRDEWFLQLAPARDTVVLNKRWSNLDDMPPFNLRDLLNLIAKLEGTPVEERFPEKKYRLRWIDDELGNTFLGFNYSCDTKFWSAFSGSCSNIVFTGSELEQLKKDNPRLAPAIDAMKEEVKDNETD